MARKRFILTGFVLAALLTGCGKEEVAPEGMDSLCLSVTREGDTRAVSQVQPDAASYLIAAGNKIGVYGTLTRSGQSDMQVFTKQTVTCGENLDWTYSPLKYWKRFGVYDFKAVYPLSANILAGTSGKRLLVGHVITSNHCDLLVASAQRNVATQGTDPVELKFKHACSAVRFLFKKESAADTYELSAFKLQNLRIGGTLDLSGDALTLDNWHTSGMAPAAEVMAWTAASAADRKDIPLSYDDFTAVPWAYMIPQTMAVQEGTARPAVTFSVVFNGEPTSVEITLPLPDSYEEGGQTVPATWEPGKVYTYYINLKPSRVALTVHVTPWDSETLVIDENVVFD